MTSAQESPYGDCPHWFGLGLVDTECQHLGPYMTADECELDRPKLMVLGDESLVWSIPGGGVEPFAGERPLVCD